ncbi:MAG: YIP1 family protein [Candidatus Azobacteroides sp.]|nr:YIP1 family protein [Candidatus Azobacteroides sp.]
MYKQLIIRLFNIVIRPEKTWKACNDEQDNDNTDFFKSYLYPIFGIIALFSFVGILFYLKEWNVRIAIKQVIKETIPYFAGYFIAVFALSRLSATFFDEKPTNSVCERFTGYASAAVYVTAALYALFPFFPIIQVLTLYTFYIVWQGAVHYLRIKEQLLTKFTIFASILIILAPLIVRWALSLTMPD